VLFSNYFIHGINVFMQNAYWRDIQINATDVNWDGYTLTISDLVYLIRIILELETPFGQGHKLAPTDEVAGMIASIKGEDVVISSKSDVPIGAAVYVFKHAGISNLTNLSNMEMKYSDTGSELRVLLWSLDGKSVPAGSSKLFSFEGKNVELVSVEAADNLGRTLKGTITTKNIPTSFALLGNYPNPFNPATNISFALPENSKVSLKIYNIAGQLVWSHEKYYEAGTHTITWDGTNLNGESVGSGVYFYRLVAGANSATKKMVMTK
jgi:flagellar hook assembly protein FlgD